MSVRREGDSMLLGLFLLLSGLLFPPLAHFWMLHHADLITAAELATHDSIQHAASVIAVVVGFELSVAAWYRRPIRPSPRTGGPGRS